MLENLKEFFENEQVKAIIALAMLSLQAVSFESDTIKVTINPDNDTLNISIEQQPIAQTEAAHFKDYLNGLTDDVFVGVSEMIGKDKIKQISTCLQSDDIEVVRAGILAFKTAVREYAVSKYQFYKDLAAKE